MPVAASVFVLATNELADFVQGASQFVHFPAQLIHFVVPVVTLVLVVIPAVVAIPMFTVVTMGASLHFFGDVMHAGGMEMFDGYH